MTDSKLPVRRAIVLAAGLGSRLVTGEEIPKPLKPVAGVPLLVRILRTLEGAGIKQAVIVVGYRGEQLRRALLAEPSLSLELLFVVNEAWDRGANGVSLICARDYLDEDCILSMADHLYSPQIVLRLQEAELHGACALAVDRDIPGCFDIDDATMARVATTLGARGTLKTTTLKAIEVDDYIDAMGEGLG